VVTTAELRGCGVSRSGITRRRQRGWIHQLFPGVWSIGHGGPPWEGRILAAVKACGPTALASHYTAAEVWGFVDRLERVPDVTVTASSVRRRPRIRTHRAAHLDPVDIRERDGIPLTSPPLALLEIAVPLGAHRARAALRRALGLERLTIRQIGLVLDRYPGHRGSAILRDAVALGAAPTKSDRESDVLDVILAGGLAHPDVNRPLMIAGRRIIPDFRWPEQRLILEADSDAWHDDPLARADDLSRQRLLEAHGETVLRVHWRDAVLRPGRTVARLREAGAPANLTSRGVIIRPS
jgi:very-short-patch-repair endonuclease